jgi:hypothetical protein
MIAPITIAVMMPVGVIVSVTFVRCVSETAIPPGRLNKRSRE